MVFIRDKKWRPLYWFTMEKENLVVSTSAKIIKKALPLGARVLLGFGFVFWFSTDRYHDDPSLDKSQNEPTNQKTLPEVEDLEFEFPLIAQKKAFESPAFISYPVKLLEPQTPQIQINPIEQKIEQYKVKLDGIEKKMILRKDLFSEQDFEDLRIYYPIYAAASEKYNIPWYLLWITHKGESTVSRNPEVFKPGGLHHGSMQRAVKFYSKEDVRIATTGLEFLAELELPQRHFDDWEEIVWAASKLRRDWDATGSLLGALHSYSALGPAEFRYYQFQIFSQIFEQKSK